MARKLDSDSQIGRRLTLRDLHLFFTVVQHGSMAKAAAQLGISQPSVPEVIADLEQTLGARLFDRRPRGVDGGATLELPPQLIEPGVPNSTWLGALNISTRN